MSKDEPMTKGDCEDKHKNRFKNAIAIASILALFIVVAIGGTIFQIREDSAQTIRIDENEKKCVQLRIDLKESVTKIDHKIDDMRHENKEEFREVQKLIMELAAQ